MRDRFFRQLAEEMGFAYLGNDGSPLDGYRFWLPGWTPYLLVFPDHELKNACRKETPEERVILGDYWGAYGRRVGSTYLSTICVLDRPPLQLIPACVARRGLRFFRAFPHDGSLEKANCTDDKSFSRTYKVYSDESAEAGQMLSPAVRNLLLKHKGKIDAVQFNGSVLLVSHRGFAGPSELKELLGLTYEIAQCLPVREKAPRKISAVDLVNDLRAGMNHADIMAKYGLGKVKFITILGQLVAKGLLREEELK